MRRDLYVVALSALLLSSFVHAQNGNFNFPAGSPEDQALTAVTSEQDAQKRLVLLQDFVQKFSANPAAVGYGNWQMAQYYQGVGDPAKALEYGDKALAASPGNLNLFVFQTNVAQQLKDNDKVVDYATRGGIAYHAAAKDANAAEPKAEGAAPAAPPAASDDDKASYEFLEASAFAAIANETDPKARMKHIEKFTPAFPNSKDSDQVTSYAMVALTELNHIPRPIC